MGVWYRFRGPPAGALGTVPPAGRSGDGWFAAWDGDVGVRGNGGAVAPRASETPPQSAIDNKDDSTQNPAAFTEPHFTAPLRPDMTSALNWIASEIAAHQHDEHHDQH
jgi:hypothetical protein